MIVVQQRFIWDDEWILLFIGRLASGRICSRPYTVRDAQKELRINSVFVIDTEGRYLQEALAPEHRCVLEVFVEKCKSRSSVEDSALAPGEILGARF